MRQCWKDVCRATRDQHDSLIKSYIDSAGVAPVDLDSAIPLPAYSETIEEVVDAAIRRLGRLRAKRDLLSPHGGLRKVLAAEAQRLERSKSERWSYDKPHFAEARFQRQLRVFSSIFQ